MYNIYIDYIVFNVSPFEIVILTHLGKKYINNKILSIFYLIHKNSNYLPSHDLLPKPGAQLHEKSFHWSKHVAPL